MCLPLMIIILCASSWAKAIVGRGEIDRDGGRGGVKDVLLHPHSMPGIRCELLIIIVWTTGVAGVALN